METDRKDFLARVLGTLLILTVGSLAFTACILATDISVAGKVGCAAGDVLVAGGIMMMIWFG